MVCNTLYGFFMLNQAKFSGTLQALRYSFLMLTRQAVNFSIPVPIVVLKFSALGDKRL